MPRYDYHCTECDHTLEVRQKITEDALRECPACGRATLQRGPGGGAGLIFKGSGFYITDYKNKPAEKPPKEKESKSDS